MSLVKDDKQQSSDSIAAAPAAFVALLLASVNSDSYPLRILSYSCCNRDENTNGSDNKTWCRESRWPTYVYAVFFVGDVILLLWDIFLRCSYKSSGSGTDPWVSIR
jgi:hypothetical protein